MGFNRRAVPRKKFCPVSLLGQQKDTAKRLGACCLHNTLLSTSLTLTGQIKQVREPQDKGALFYLLAPVPRTVFTFSLYGPRLPRKCWLALVRYSLQTTNVNFYMHTVFQNCHKLLSFIPQQALRSQPSWIYLRACFLLAPFPLSEAARTFWNQGHHRLSELSWHLPRC